MVVLKDLVTEHPGGWQDVIDYVGTVSVDLMQVDYRVRRIFHATKADELVREREETDVRVSLSVLEGEISGRLASQAYRILMFLGCPVPGDPEWLRPCSQWGPRRG